MNTEQPLQPPDATIVNEPDPDEERTYETSPCGSNQLGPDDELRIYKIGAEVLQVGMLSERIQQALNDYHTDHADIDVMALLLEECQLERQENNTLLAGVRLDIDVLINDLAKQAF